MPYQFNLLVLGGKIALFFPWEQKNCGKRATKSKISLDKDPTIMYFLSVFLGGSLLEKVAADFRIG